MIKECSSEAAGVAPSTAVTQLSVVCPTFNEAENVPRLVEALTATLQGISYEILIVDDDSPDLTWQKAEEIAERNPHVRVLRRRSNRGLSASVIDGFSQARGEFVACMDADLQHDQTILPAMLEQLKQGAGIVVGSRYMTGGGFGDWNWMRRMESRAATKMSHWILRTQLSDPMSGFFMMRRADFMLIRDSLRSEGFKILLEIVVALKPEVVGEVPFTFRSRVAGESKLTGDVVRAYLRQLRRLAKFTLPIRFLKFALVGASGIVVNLAVMAFLLHQFALKDWRASALASLVAMASNYVLNNVWTFQDRVRTGLNFLTGFFAYFVSSVLGMGATTVTYVALTKCFEFVFGSAPSLVAIACQFVGILLGCILNYKLNKSITWRERNERASLA